MMPHEQTVRNRRLLERWTILGQQLDHPDVELDLETFLPVLATYRALRRGGVQFDPTLAALMSLLEKQAFRHDGDTDGSDRHLQRAWADHPRHKTGPSYV